MTRPTRAEWVAELRKLRGHALEQALTNRVREPESVGSPLNDLEHEAPETVIIEAANLDDVLRNELDKVIRGIFDRLAGSEGLSEERLARGCLEVVRQLALYGSSLSIRDWLSRFRRDFEDPSKFGLVAATLKALAVAQSPSENIRRFWRDLVEEGPEAWVAGAFAALRVASPAQAMALLPMVAIRANQDVGKLRPIVRGIWQQPDARAAFARWVDSIGRPLEPKSVIDALQLELANDSLALQQLERWRQPRKSVFGIAARSVHPIADVKPPAPLGRNHE